MVILVAIPETDVHLSLQIERHHHLDLTVKLGSICLCRYIIFYIILIKGFLLIKIVDVTIIRHHLQAYRQATRSVQRHIIAKMVDTSLLYSQKEIISGRRRDISAK